ncbi:porimin [Elgaria multicarinata webbii]|uniref:porimin n=1 Tax=Elgaria multicarinata webbii TaxID=159646 RepID=UPI002FCCDA10
MKALLLLVVAVLVPFCLAADLEDPQERNSTKPTTHLPNSTVTTRPPKPSVTAMSTNSSGNETKATNTPAVTSHATANTSKATATPQTVKPTAHSIKPTAAKSNGTVLPASSVTATPKAAAPQAASSGFSAGSFIGGIVLTLGLLAIGYVGCRTYHSKRGVQYRTIDEHDAII